MYLLVHLMGCLQATWMKYAKFDPPAEVEGDSKVLKIQAIKV